MKTTMDPTTAIPTSADNLAVWIAGISVASMIATFGWAIRIGIPSFLRALAEITDKFALEIAKERDYHREEIKEIRASFDAAVGRIAVTSKCPMERQTDAA